MQRATDEACFYACINGCGIERRSADFARNSYRTPGGEWTTEVPPCEPRKET